MEKLSSRTYGQAFTFDASVGFFDGYRAGALFADILRDLKFTGICEYFSGDQFWAGSGSFTVGLLLQFEEGTTPEFPYWLNLREMVKEGAGKNFMHMEAAKKRDIQRYYLPHGTFRLVGGVLEEFLESDEVNEGESTFISTLLKRKNLRDS